MLADQHRVIGQPDRALVQRAGHGVRDRLPRRFVDDQEHRLQRLPDRVPLRPAGQRRGHGVQVGDAPLDIGRDDRVTDARQRHPQRVAPLVGAHLRRAHRLADSDDEAAGEEIRDHPHHVCRVPKAKRAARRDEKVRAREVADDGDDAGWKVAARPDGDGDRAEEGHERQRVAQQRIEQPADEHRQDERGRRQRVASHACSHGPPHQQT